MSSATSTTPPRAAPSAWSEPITPEKPGSICGPTAGPSVFGPCAEKLLPPNCRSEKSRRCPIMSGNGPQGPGRPRMSRQRIQLIYLVGFMGSGKTTTGRRLADELHWPFVDLDQTIEAGQGLSIRQIFEQLGEPFFRELEHAALTEASK